jgi:hypothetical protein
MMGVASPSRTRGLGNTTGASPSRKGNSPTRKQK